MATYSDAFSQSNESPLSSSGSWLTYSGEQNLKVVSNAVRFAGTIGSGQDALEVAVLTTKANAYGKATLKTWTTASTNTQAMIALRCAAPNTASCYILGARKNWQGGTNQCQIAKLTAGAFASLALGTTAFSSGDLMEAHAIGATLSLFKNGVLILSVVDSTYTAAGYVGLSQWLGGGAEGEVEFDNFEGGDMTAPAVPVINTSDISTATMFIDNPAEASTKSGAFNVDGWAFDNSLVSQVEVFVDGVSAGLATYGSARGDVATLYPNCPTNIGYTKALNTASYSVGARVINVKVTDTNGLIAMYADRHVTFS